MTATQSLYKGKSVGIPIDPVVDLGLDSPRLRYFGGTTNHWSGYCRPFPELDFQARSYVPRSGWPIARTDLDGYYAAAGDVIGLGPADYSLSFWRDQGYIAQPLLEDPSTPHTILQLTSRPVFGQVYHDEIVDSPSVQLVLWANATRLALSGDGNSVASIDVKTLSNNAFTAEASAYVVATGGLEVPRLLLASNDRRPAGIGNEHDLVGRCFMEHVNITTGPVVMSNPESAVAAYAADARHRRSERGTARPVGAGRAPAPPGVHATTRVAVLRGDARVPLRTGRQAAAIDPSDGPTRHRPVAGRGRRRPDGRELHASSVSRNRTRPAG